MTHKQANEIVLKCIDQYDMDNMIVNEEWWSTYQEVVAQLKAWGLPLR